MIGKLSYLFDWSENPHNVSNIISQFAIVYCNDILVFVLCIHCIYDVLVTVCVRCAWNGVSDACGLTGEGVAVGDAGGRCDIYTIGFDLLSGQECFTVWITSCFYKKQACLKQESLEPLELVRAS